MKICLKRSDMKISKTDFLIYISLFLFTVVEIDARTSTPILSKFPKFFVLGAMAMVLLEMIASRTISYRNIILFTLISILLVINFLPSGLHMLLYLFLIIWGVRNSSMDKYLYFEIMLIAVCTILVVLLSRSGIYKDIVTEQMFQGVIRQRHSLGFSSWTILPFQFLSLTSYYIYLKKGNVSAFMYLVFAAIGYWIYYFTDTKSAFVYLIALIAVCWTLKFVEIKKWDRLKAYMSAPWIFAAGSILGVELYRGKNLLLTQIDAVINRRLYYASKAMEKYGIHILSHGYEAMFYSDPTNYLVVDNSYIFYLLKYGLSGLLLILVLYTCIIYFAIKRKDKYLLAITVLMLFVNIMWQRLLSLPDFAFLLCAGEAFKRSELMMKKRRNCTI